MKNVPSDLRDLQSVGALAHDHVCQAALPTTRSMSRSPAAVKRTRPAMGSSRSPRRTSRSIASGSGDQVSSSRQRGSVASRSRSNVERVTPCAASAPAPMRAKRTSTCVKRSATCASRLIARGRDRRRDVCQTAAAASPGDVLRPTTGDDPRKAAQGPRRRAPRPTGSDPRETALRASAASPGAPRRGLIAWVQVYRAARPAKRLLIRSRPREIPTSDSRS